MSDGVSPSRHQQDVKSSALRGVRICLVFEHGLSYYTRILQEIRALQEAGATVQLLTSHSTPGPAPPGVQRTVAALDSTLAGSTLKARPLRVAHNLARNATADLLTLVRPEWKARHRAVALKRIASEVDLFWVVDFPSLPTTIAAAKPAGVKVLYETVDLVPEYEYLGEAHRRESLEGERALIGRLDGFVTACDGYADYYMETYGALITRPPVVRHDMPERIRTSVNPSKGPLRIIFLGALMFDRPILELIEAIALTTASVTLTFQGKNHLGHAPAARIRDLKLEHRVRILDPCPPDRVVETAAGYDVGVVALYGSNENERRASTTKLFAYMAAGLAVLASDLPGISRIVNAHHNGVLVRGVDPQAWSAAMDEMGALPLAAIDAMKQHSLEAAGRYSWERERPAFIGEFVRALGQEGGQPT
jgi:glycosyltransferase involved in cell wall biosynthesis